MFHFIKQRGQNYGKVYSPCAKGRIFSICDVKDAIIADGLMGNGFAVEPADGIVRAPVDGTIVNIWPTGHMFSMLTSDDQAVIVHVGTDTVQANGDGFTILKKPGVKVKHGEPILKFDYARLNKQYDTSVITVMPCCADLTRTEIHLERSCKEAIIEYGED